MNPEQTAGRGNSPGNIHAARRVLMGGGGGVWYSLFIKNLAHYSSH